MAFGDKRLFIAKRIKVENDEFGNEISYYETPKEYGFSYMPTSGQVDYQIYGELISNMFTSILPMSFLGKIKTGDKAYLIDGEIQDIDNLVYNDLNDEFCTHANYIVKLVQSQNIRIKIIFEKITSNGGKK